MPGLVLQCRPRESDRAPLDDGPRVGFTASRKVGGAVVRNRARRRLRAVAQAVLSARGNPDCDYVLIARRNTVDRAFADLAQDLVRALAGVGPPCGASPAAGGGR